MEHASALGPVGIVLQICLIDLLLSGDNALLIALVCRGLPVSVRRQVVWLGTFAALALRVVLTALATFVLRVPYLKLVGAVLLIAIGIQLLAQDPHAPRPGAAEQPGLWKALTTILVADTVMSLDNVLAVAAAAQGSLSLLSFGLALSVPILIFGSLMVTRLLDRYPLLILAGGGVLGWVAGGTATSDPAIASWLDSQSFGLAAGAPLIGAVYVMVQGALLRKATHAGAALTPAPLPPAAGEGRSTVAKTPATPPLPHEADIGLSGWPEDAQVETVPTEVLSAPEPAQPATPAQAEGPSPNAAGRRTDLIITAAVLLPLTALILIVYFVAWTIRHH